MTKLMRHADTLAYGIDLLMLLFVGVLPFSTNLLVTHLSGPDVEAAVVIYGVNVLLASLCLSLLMFYIASERSLVVDGVADETLEAKVRQRWIVIALNVAAIALAVVAPARCRRGVPRHDVPRAGPPVDPPSSAPALGLRRSELCRATGTTLGPDRASLEPVGRVGLRGGSSTPGPASRTGPCHHQRSGMPEWPDQIGERTERPTPYAAPRNASTIQSGNTIRGVETGGSSPLAPTTYGYSELLG